MEKNTVINNGRVKFYAKSQVLIDLCLMIIEGNNVSNINHDINVYVGIHQWLFEKIPNNILSIGIQTEQLYDDTGKRISNHRYSYSTIFYQNKFDIIVDLSKSNYLAYTGKNIIFGPYIFPESCVTYDLNNINSYNGIFFGHLSERRVYILNNLPNIFNINIANGFYYNELMPLIRDSKFVLNIHNEEGKYTEWPRLLLAYLRGKSLVSENLCSELLPGTHYILIGDHIDEKKLKNVFDNITEDFCSKYSFINLLNKIESFNISRKNRFINLFNLVVLLIQILFIKITNKILFFYGIKN